MEAVGIFTALMGVFLVSTHGNPTSLVISPALFLVHLSAIAMTLYTVAPAHILKEYSSPYLMGGGSSFRIHPSSLYAIPFIPGWKAGRFFSIGAMGYIMSLGRLCHFSCTLTASRSLAPSRHLSSAAVNLFVPSCFLSPFLGTFLALPDYLGVVCIVGTVVMLSLK